MARPLNILILCTGNSARSILGEAVLNRVGQGRLRAYSAGSQPKGEPNPLALELLAHEGYDTAGFRSKSWNEFAGPDDPVMDIVITVCDSAAGEACPYWPGTPVKAHWGIADPASVEGPIEIRREAFSIAYQRLLSRATALVKLPLETLAPAALATELGEIGGMDGATLLARTLQAR